MKFPKHNARGWAAAVAAVVLLCGALPLVAEHTRFWRQSRYDEFEKGTAHDVAMRSDGKLMLAPRFADFGDANLAYLWALRFDSKGNLYAAGGSSAKVVRFDAQGKATKVFESAEMTAQALAIDAHDNLYVATSPDGKVYRVTPAGQSSVFFDPKTKYIWDLALDSDGTLYVATGDSGKIFAVAPDGTGQLFYSGDETHIRALALDGKGNLIAGTEPNGRILRIPKAAPPAEPNAAAANPPTASAAGSAPPAAEHTGRRAFVLYETEKKEVTALLIDPKDGSIYAAAIGEKPRVTQPLPGFAPVQPAAQQTTAPTLTFSNQDSPAAQAALTAAAQTQALAFVPFPSLNSSAVYRIAPDGSPTELWSSHDLLVYSLARAQSGELLLGTGNHGAVLELDGNQIFSEVAKTSAEQITGLAAAPNGAVYLATANPGKVFSLGPGDAAEGTFESQAFDARIFSHWGRISWWGEGAAEHASGAGARVELYARSGNTSTPDDNWSTWSGPYTDTAGQTVDCPPARFIQWKAVLQRGTGSGAASSPQVAWVSVAYLPKNVAPVIDAVVVQDPGVRVQGPSNGGGGAIGAGPTPVQLRLASAPDASSLMFDNAANQGSNARFEPPPQGFRQKGYESVLWSANDENDDTLEFSVYYRGEGETNWMLLKDKIDQRFYSWDTSSMPDGAYYLKIVASDSPSNPPDDALTAERESDRFLVDNTPPVLTGLTADPTSAVAGAAAGSATARIRFDARDPGSTVARAQYSLDAGDWTLVLPAGQLNDAPQEHFDWTLPGVLAPGEHTLAVRVYDEYENMTSAKVTFTIGAAAASAGKPH
jgi:sugar lactone lactonase YvrE